MAVIVDSIPAAPATASSLAPGFRFHPTDEELVWYYLRRKICAKPFRIDAISDVEVYKVEPWDLPGLSRLKTRDLEWYFFSVLDKKYGNGSRTNRATDRGYWKTTGKDRSVYHRSKLIGMKKTLVYHIGRAPKGERTNWVMHEYRLIDQDLEKAGVVQDAFVLCRIFRKSGSGPKNGEQYGAPFVDEEWEDDELVMVPKQEFADELLDDNDAYLDADDLEKILGVDTPDQDGPLLIEYNQGDVPKQTVNEQQNFLVGEDEKQPQVDQEDGPKLFDLPVHNEWDPTSVKHEYIGETSNATDYDVDYLLDEPVFDASTGDFIFDGTSFFEADDIKNEVKTEPGLEMFEDYTSYLNLEMDTLNNTFNSIGNENILPESSLKFENVNEETHELGDVSEQFFEVQNNDLVSLKLDHQDLVVSNLEGQNNIAASTSNQEHPDSGMGTLEGTRETGFEGEKDYLAPSKQEDADFSTDFSFLQRASYMLGNMSAPSAFASTKYLAAASQASTSVRVTTGMIRITDISFTGSKLDWSFNKNGHLDIILSFGLKPNYIESEDSHELTSRKANSVVSRSLFYCIFLWIMVLSMSFKISSLVCPKSFMS
ncbi:NAC domain-containing protein 53-like [Rutidosis leptorrhynchoides]|uniref:NAC domain-containing protein 53-like n=1 Tax=Rutidosis leptorrhynchoides TaxID=125765 RepID=UPI003A98E3B2